MASLTFIVTSGCACCAAPSQHEGLRLCHLGNRRTANLLQRRVDHILTNKNVLELILHFPILYEMGVTGSRLDGLQIKTSPWRWNK